MNSRTEYIDGIGEIKITKKRGLKRISMRLHPSGQVRVSVPYVFTFSAGVKFAQQHQDWISKQRVKSVAFTYYDGMAIGKKHKICIVESRSSTIRIKEGNIYINKNSSPDDLEVKKSIKRALNLEAKEVLPERLQYLADKYGFKYEGVIIKPMKSRWGACSSSKYITLNCYLMMLPWVLIDYVLVHELAHTKQMNHSAAFWEEVAAHIENYKELRKQLRIIQPQVHSLYI